MIWDNYLYQGCEVLGSLAEPVSRYYSNCRWITTKIAFIKYFRKHRNKVFIKINLNYQQKSWQKNMIMQEKNRHSGHGGKFWLLIWFLFFTGFHTIQNALIPENIWKNWNSCINVLKLHIFYVLPLCQVSSV